MIPITDDQTVKWTDPEDQTVFEFGYLTGEKADEFMRLSGGGSMSTIRPWLKQATDNVRQKAAGKRWKKGEETAAVLTEAQRLARAAGIPEDQPEESTMRRIVDMVVKKWSGKDRAGKDFCYSFPEPDGAVSKFLALADQAKVWSAISDRLKELARLDAEEVKN